LDHNFDPVSKLNSLQRAIRDPQLSSSAKLVYTSLVFRYNSETKKCNPSVETISQDIGNKSTRTIERALQELRRNGYITNFRGYPGIGSNLYQLKDTKVGLFKQIYTTNLTSIDDKNVGHTPTPVSCKTINETIKETINTSKESELNKDSLSEVERVNNNDDTKVESEVVKDTDKESVTHERLLELIPVLREGK
jgi:DNA-binding transcriptional regulator YhcF (GntR family)